MRVAGSLRPGTISSIHQRPRGRRVLSDSEDNERPVVEDKHTTVIDDKPPSVWQRLSLKQLRWTAVALILVVTAAFGGLESAHHVTYISLGQTYNAGPVQFTAHSAALVGRPAADMPRPSPECQYLMLRATIRNTANESVPFPRPGVVGGSAQDCNHPARKDTEMFAMTGIANRVRRDIPRRRNHFHPHHRTRIHQ